MTKEIRLTQGQVTIVDDWRYDELNQYKWFALWSPKTRSFYAGRNSATVGGKRTTVSMHMVIAGTPRGMQTDHVDHDTLNNTEANLRVCTASQNKQNCVRRSDNTSGYKGVFPAHSRWGWQAVIGVDKKSVISVRTPRVKKPLVPTTRRLANFMANLLS